MGNIATAAFGVSFLGSVVAWIILITGTGALYAICPEGCIFYFGLAWWAVVLQAIILVTTIPVGVMGVRSFKGPVLALLAANTAVTMTQTDGFLSTRLFNQFYSGFPTRMDAVISGFALVSFFNVLMILSLGFVDEEDKKRITIPHRSEFTRANSAYSNHSCGGMNGAQT